MSTNNTTTTDRKDTVISTAQTEAILCAIRSLHGIVWNWGKNESFPPSFDDLSIEQISALLDRTSRALKVRHNNEKDVANTKVRTAVDTVVQESMSATRSAKIAFDALPESVRKVLPAFPKAVAVPVAKLGAVFGTSNASVIVKHMQDLGYALDARSVAKQKDCKEIFVPFTA